MKSIPLTKGYTAFIDDADYARVGAFKWTAEERRRKDGIVAYVYAKRRESGRTQYLHRR